MYGVHVLLHISVFLFFCGVSDYLHDVLPEGWHGLLVLRLHLSGGVCGSQHFPPDYRQLPLPNGSDPPLLFGSTLLLFFCRTAWRAAVVSRTRGFATERRAPLRQNPLSRGTGECESGAPRPYAMKWLFTDDDFSDTDMDKFLEGLPGYIHSHFTVTRRAAGGSNCTLYPPTHQGAPLDVCNSNGTF
jgi:hypothetical protein